MRNVVVGVVGVGGRGSAAQRKRESLLSARLDRVRECSKAQGCCRNHNYEIPC